MPPMTLTEKILARHAGRDHVQPGENVITVGGVGLEDNTKVRIESPNAKPGKEEDKGDKEK